MDIWKWVDEIEKELADNGHHRLAALIADIPAAVVNNRHGEVDSLVPEAIAMARSIGNSWLEIFFRHWNLQDRLFNRFDPQNLLPEVTALIDFAHREENRECPQSVCVIQDLAQCYRLIDGPGYAEESGQAIRETLARIDVQWPCFRCLTVEQVKVLCDQQRFGDALAFLRQQDQALLKAHKQDERQNIKLDFAEVLMGLSEFDRALAYAEKASAPLQGENYKLRRQLIIARAAYHAGDVDRAKKELAAFEKIADTECYFELWTKVAFSMAMDGQMPNDWQLHQKFQFMAEKLTRNGVLRKAFDIHTLQLKLALRRRFAHTAATSLDQMRAIVPRLRKPRLVDHIVANAEAELKALQTNEAPTEADAPRPDDLLSQLTDDPEADLLRIDAGLQAHPAHEDLAHAKYNAEKALGHNALAESYLQAFVRRHPEAADTFLRLGQARLEANQFDELQALVDAVLERAPSAINRLNAHWLLTLSHHQQNEFEKAIQHAHEVLALKPDAKNTLRLLAEMTRDTGQLEASIGHYNALIEIDPEQTDHHWDRMMVATLQEDWPLVRASAQAVGYDLEGEGPIEANFGICTIEMANAYGDRQVLYARRNSPVTARIIEVSKPSQSCHYMDTILFDPVNLNAEAAQDTEEESPPRYPLYRILAKGGYRSYGVDGFHPGEAEIETLRESLQSLNVRLQVESGDNYQIQIDEDDSATGFYGYLAVQEATAIEDVADALRAFNADRDHPLIWPEIAKLVDDEEFRKQKDFEKRYQL